LTGAGKRDLVKAVKALVLHAVNTPPEVEELAPVGPGPEEACVRLAASGVCHSDYSVYDGTLPGTLPMILGHEGAGVVEAVGSDVTVARPGDHVVLSWTPDCGRCFYCQLGQPTQCELGPKLVRPLRRYRKGEASVSQMAGLGTMSELAVVHQMSLIPIDPELPLDKAALVGCAVMTGVGAAINTAKVEPGSSVAVFGCGGVGLNVIQGARLAGAERIIAVDRLDNKLTQAKRFGATHTLRPDDGDVVEAIRALTHGRVADYTFEVIGLPEVMAKAYYAARPAGTVVIIGGAAPGTRLSISAGMVPRFEKKLLGSYYGSARPRVDMPRLLGLYRSGRLLLDELITRTYSIAEAWSAFKALEAGENIRGVIRFPA
jgi:S-(hydroxymethyl)glutathione dehydrogenase/alcohol dehydrogenase